LDTYGVCDSERRPKRHRRFEQELRQKLMSVLGGGFNGSTQHLPILADEAGCDAVTLKVGRPRVPTSGGKTSVLNQKHTDRGQENGGGRWPKPHLGPVGLALLAARLRF
jgi:hypothetical protein